MENFENEAKKNLNTDQFQNNQNDFLMDMEDCIEDVELDAVSGGKFPGGMSTPRGRDKTHTTRQTYRTRMR